MPSKTAKRGRQNVKIFILVFDGFNLLDTSGPAQVFSQANDVESNLSIEYKVCVVSKTGGLVQSGCGVRLMSSKLAQVSSGNSTLLVAGGTGVHEAIKDKELVNWLKKKVCTDRYRTGSVCTGSFLLAMTGILDGKRAVTHWRSVDRFQQQFPQVLVDGDPIYINDQGVWTSAGITAGIDLALAMVAEDLGNQSSLETARELVVYLKRSGGQSQFSTPLFHQTKDKLGQFCALHNWMQKNLCADMSITRLADHMNMSERTFYRAYKKVVGMTPAKSVEKYRIEAVKGKLENSVSSILSIALSCGFQNEVQLRRAFLSQVGISPQEYRARFKIH